VEKVETLADEVKEILHDMAEYSKKNMICPFGEEELMKEYLSIEKTEDSRAIVSILYVVIHNHRRQNDDKDEIESLDSFFDEFPLMLDINKIKDSRFRQIVAGACDVVGLDKTTIEYWKEHPEETGIYFFSDMEKERRLKRKEKIIFFCTLIFYIIINIHMSVKDIRYLLGIIGSIILYFISMSKLPFHTFWNDMIPIPFLVAMCLCYID